MDSATVKSLLENELNRDAPYKNLHGILPTNIRSFLVEPFTVVTDPDDIKTQPRDMWVVLQVKRTPAADYVIVFDPYCKAWGVAEHTSGNKFTLIVSGPSLAGALDAM